MFQNCLLSSFENLPVACSCLVGLLGAVSAFFVSFLYSGHMKRAESRCFPTTFMIF